MSFTLSMSPFMEALLGDQQVNSLFSVQSDVSALLKFEMELARAQEACGIIPQGVSKVFEHDILNRRIDIDGLARAMSRDGVVVPHLVAALKQSLGPEHAAHVHYAATSQDAVDTSLAIRAKAAFSHITGMVETIEAQLVSLRSAHGTRTLHGRTRMQQALPITVADRISSWQNNVAAAVVELRRLHFPLQLFGPVGTGQISKVHELMAGAMGLSVPAGNWQNSRSAILAYGNACAGLAGALGKIGVDIALMAQNEIAEINLSGGGSSSAMSHKHNPVKAEVLVTLARFSATLISGLHQAAVHEQERSGAAWTLEWLVLPQMICAAAGSARLAHELLDQVESIGT